MEGGVALQVIRHQQSHRLIGLVGDDSNVQLGFNQ